MRVGSTFSGIGGFDEGLRRAGHDHVFFCEADAYRRDVLSARFPGIPIYDDVRSVGVRGEVCEERQGRAGAGDRDAAQGAVGADGQGRLGAAGVREGDDGSRPAPIDARRREVGGSGRVAAADSPLGGPEGLDLLVGGFPCQDVSVAGRRAGLAGERSGLFHEFARIAESFRPRWILIENVPGLFSSNGGRDFGVVLGTLADIRYGLAWRTLDSRFFGVPQRRRRVFIVGTLTHGDPRAAAERAGAVLAVGSSCPRHTRQVAEAEQGAAHVLADRSGSRVARTLGSLAAGGYRTTDLDGVPAFVSENQRAEVRETPSARQPTTGGGKPGQGYPMMRAGDTLRRLTPRECERLQGFPDDWTLLEKGGPDSRRYAGLGDAVTVNVAEWIGRRLTLIDDRPRTE